MQPLLQLISYAILLNLGDQAKHGVKFRMLHVNVTAPPGAAFVSLTATIVINLSQCAWTLAFVITVFSLNTSVQHYFVTNLELMVNSFGIFCLVVLDNLAHLAVMDALPICFKSSIELGISSKH